MRDFTKLTEFCKRVENIFTIYRLEYNYDSKGEVTSVLIRSTNDIFSDTFLRIMFDNLKDYTIYFKCDSTDRPIVKIIVE